MARKSTTSKVWISISILSALSLTFAMGWWLGHRSKPVEMNTSSVQEVREMNTGSVEDLRSDNDDLIRFIDESYASLREEGFHIQLDLEVDQDGHYRLRADSVKLTDDLKTKLQELHEK